jgi:MFS transporter, DHA2 family, multidrug resistance protein
MLMQTLDFTIANVALPYMEGSLSTSTNEITWVLTSYVIAAAIMTAPVGWMARRFGRKKLLIGAVAGFTVASMLCGAAQTLDQRAAFTAVVVDTPACSGGGGGGRLRLGGFAT